MKADKPAPKIEDIELHPDAWERFGEFVKRLAKAGPQHRVTKPALEAKQRPASKGRVHKGKTPN
jgi:hypothetical protein